MISSGATPLSVLVADDEPGIRDLLKHWIARAGNQVVCAASGDEAVRLLRSAHFDLVITDIVMPDGDGFELIASIKLHQPQACIIAMSGGGKYLQSADCLKMARGLGAHGIVMKPFNWEEMRKAIESTLPARVSTRA